MPPRQPRRQNSGESFNFGNISAEDSDDGNAPKIGPAAVTTVVNPVVKPAGRSNRALDVDLFFQRGKSEPSICKYCR